MILAGGRGTRFWPLSRQRRAKQLLALDGKQTMIQQTVSRLLPLASPACFWVITNQHLRREIMRQLPRLSKRQILAEPVGRNTAPAIGLAAFILLNRDPTAVLGLFPSDHVIGDEKRYRAVLKNAVEIAASGENIVVLGIRPTRAETGYGYIEAGSPFQGDALRVRRFTEKPDAARAAEFVQAGNYFWNSGMFLWSARTLANALLEHLPKTAALLQQIAAPSERANLPPHLPGSIRNAKTSASTMPCSNPLGQGRTRIATSSAFPPILDGTIWAHGRRCTNTMSARATRRMTI